MLTYAGWTVRHWREYVQDGELRIDLTVEDDQHHSGRRVIAVKGRDVARVKLANRAVIEALRHSFIDQPRD